MPAVDVLKFEKLAMAAWPALETVERDGWLLRTAGGCTKRANSVNAIQPRGDFAGVLAFAEEHYRSQGLPAVFRISPLAPAQADRVLARQGYVVAEASWVMTGPVEAQAIASGVIIDEVPDLDWLDGVAKAQALNADLYRHHHAMIRTIGGDLACITVVRDSAKVAYGLGVLDRGYLGLFNIIVDPAARGQGHGRDVVRALMTWGHSRGACAAYLQVHAANAAAIALYRSFGFSEAYRHHYRLPAFARS